MIDISILNLESCWILSLLSNIIMDARSVQAVSPLSLCGKRIPGGNEGREHTNHVGTVPPWHSSVGGILVGGARGG